LEAFTQRALPKEFLGNDVSCHPGMLSNVLENAIERARPQGIVIRHGHVMRTPVLRREPKMRALLPGHDIPEGFEEFGQFRPAETSPAAADSWGENLIPHDMQANHFGGLAFVEVTLYCGADVGPQFIERGSFGEDRLANGPCSEAAFWGLINDKDDLNHGSGYRERVSAAAPPRHAFSSAPTSRVFRSWLELFQSGVAEWGPDLATLLLR